MSFDSQSLDLLKNLHDGLRDIRKPLPMETYNPDRLKGWSEPGYDCPDADYTYDDYQRDCTRSNYGFILNLTDVFTPIYRRYDFHVKYTLFIKDYNPEPNALLTLLQKYGLKQKYIGDLKKWVEIWNMKDKLTEEHPFYESGYLRQCIEKACIPIVYDYADTVFQRNFAGTHSSNIPTLAKQRCDCMIVYTDSVRKKTVDVLDNILKKQKIKGK